jgi:trehalose-phosphatase
VTVAGGAPGAKVPVRASGGPGGPGIGELIERATALLTRAPFLLASDFDGTLSEVRPDPWAARIHGPSQRALRRLAATPGVRVVLFSGRTAADLAGRTRIGGVTYLGDHGVERADVPRGFRPAAMRIATVPATEAEQRTAQLLASAVPDDVPEAWLVVERKSAAVTFHYRSAPDVDLATARVLASIDRHDPGGVLERHPGRRAIELRSPSASSKAIAMATMIEELRPRSVLILGDGLDDAAAFRAVDAIARGDGLSALRLAVAGHPDVTARVAPHADGLLASPREVGRLLRALSKARPTTRRDRPPTVEPLAVAGRPDR